MRPPLALFLCLLLAACPAAGPKTAPSPDTPPPLSKTADHPQQTAALAASELVGVWTTQDEQGQQFDIVVFPNGQVVTTWTKGKDGAQGERGFWRTDGSRLIAMYDDGSTDVMAPSENGLNFQGYAAESALNAPATHSAGIHRANEKAAPFVGVWRLNKEPDGSYQYVILQSSGRALSSVNGGTEGQWTATDKGAECKWPDGWVDLIEQVGTGWQKRSFVGAGMDSPADISPALRVGESRFFATP